MQTSARSLILACFGLVATACGGQTNTTPPDSSPQPHASASAAPTNSTVASAAVVPANVDPLQVASAAATNEVKPPAPTTPPVKELQIVQSIDVGKWSEGVALAGNFAWVAESGQRKLAKIDLQTGKVVAHVDAGRLPVEMATGTDDSVYALVHTDKLVRVIDPKGGSKVFANVPDDPEDMAVSGDAIWVLLWEKSSSANSTVVRIDLKTKAQKRSPKLGPNAWQIALGPNQVWVGHDDKISVLDKETLEVKSSIDLTGGQRTTGSARTAFGRVEVGPKGAYGDYNLGVVRIDPAKFEITHRAKLGQLPLYMATTENDLWVATREGSIWQLDPQTLAARTEYRMAKPLQSHDLKIRDGLLYVTESPRPGGTEDGRLLVMRP